MQYVNGSIFQYIYAIGKLQLSKFSIKLPSRDSNPLVRTSRWSALLIIALFAETAAEAQFANPNPRIGVNIDFNQDFTPDWPWVDIFKKSREWTAERITGPTTETLNVDANGWVTSLAPGQFAITTMYTDVGPHYPAGTYVCLYEGAGFIEFLGDATAITYQPGRILVEVTPTFRGKILLRLRSTTPGNHVRNIRLIMPGFEATHATQVFHPGFLERMDPFEVIRFMDWQKTNGSPLANWADRTTIDDAFQTTRDGVALEYMVMLCNQLKSDAWFCMPHMATDNFVQQFATYVRDNLDPDLRVYIEYSNEIWNAFPQGAWMDTQATGFPGPTDFGKRIQFYGTRAIQMFDIWESVFGGTNRIVRVIGSQHANLGVSINTLDFAYNPSGTPGVDQLVSDKTDALATAPYFGFELGFSPEADAILALYNPGNLQPAIDHVMARCEALVDKEITQMGRNQDIATDRGLTHIAYEGGQHLVGVGAFHTNGNLAEVFTAANRDPRMRPLYKRYIEGWRSQTGEELFCAFNLLSTYTRFGSWGLLEWGDVPPGNSPKYVGLLEGFLGDVDFIRSTPASNRYGVLALTIALGMGGAVLLRRQRRRSIRPRSE